MLSLKQVAKNKNHPKLQFLTLTRPLNVSADAGRRFERHPAGDGRGRRHQELQERHGRERPPQPLPAGEDVVRPAAGDVEPVQPGRRLAHHEQEEGVSHHAARQAGQLLHQGRQHREQLRSTFKVSFIRKPRAAEVNLIIRNLITLSG